MFYFISLGVKEELFDFLHGKCFSETAFELKRTKQTSLKGIKASKNLNLSEVYDLKGGY